MSTRKSSRSTADVVAVEQQIELVEQPVIHTARVPGAPRTVDAYQLDGDGYFMFKTTAEESPLEPGVFHFAAGCIAVAPPALQDDQRARYNGESWLIEQALNLPSDVINESPEDALARAKLEKNAEINLAFKTAMSEVSSGYMRPEIDTWAIQESEARVYAADPAAPTPMLTALASERGITLGILVQKVLAKAHAHAITTGTLIGKRQRLELMIEAITVRTQNELDEIRWGHTIKE